ncbi:MAG: hypothetical protein GXN92_03735 [Candidatus Micrarchaeota archaeon]|nr:hypothetical protein [Candidatus Micrarchaeota archaeon]
MRVAFYTDYAKAAFGVHYDRERFCRVLKRGIQQYGPSFVSALAELIIATRNNPFTYMLRAIEDEKLALEVLQLLSKEDLLVDKKYTNPLPYAIAKGFEKVAEQLVKRAPELSDFKSILKLVQHLPHRKDLFALMWKHASTKPQIDELPQEFQEVARKVEAEKRREFRAYKLRPDNPF